MNLQYKYNIARISNQLNLIKSSLLLHNTSNSADETLHIAFSSHRLFQQGYNLPKNLQKKKIYNPF